MLPKHLAVETLHARLLFGRDGLHVVPLGGFHAGMTELALRHALVPQVRCAGPAQGPGGRWRSPPADFASFARSRFTKLFGRIGPPPRLAGNSQPSGGMPMSRTQLRSSTSNLAGSDTYPYESGVFGSPMNAAPRSACFKASSTRSRPRSISFARSANASCGRSPQEAGTTGRRSAFGGLTIRRTTSRAKTRHSTQTSPAPETHSMRTIP